MAAGGRGGGGLREGDRAGGGGAGHPPAAAWACRAAGLGCVAPCPPPGAAAAHLVRESKVLITNKRQHMLRI